MDKCLKCKNLDISDIPNLFCNISYELVNDTEFRYCPKDPKSVVEFIEKQDGYIKHQCEEIKKLEAKCEKAYQEGLLQKQLDKDMEIAELKNQLAEKDKKYSELFDKFLDIMSDYVDALTDLFNVEDELEQLKRGKDENKD